MKLSPKKEKKLIGKKIKAVNQITVIVMPTSFNCDKPIKTVTGSTLSMRMVVARAVKQETKTFNKEINYQAEK